MQDFQITLHELEVLQKWLLDNKTNRRIDRGIYATQLKNVIKLRIGLMQGYLDKQDAHMQFMLIKNNIVEFKPRLTADYGDLKEAKKYLVAGVIAEVVGYLFSKEGDRIESAKWFAKAVKCFWKNGDRSSDFGEKARSARQALINAKKALNLGESRAYAKLVVEALLVWIDTDGNGDQDAIIHCANEGIELIGRYALNLKSEIRQFHIRLGDAYFNKKEYAISVSAFETVLEGVKLTAGKYHESRHKLGDAYVYLAASSPTLKLKLCRYYGAACCFQANGEHALAASMYEVMAVIVKSNFESDFERKARIYEMAAQQYLLSSPEVELRERYTFENGQQLFRDKEYNDASKIFERICKLFSEKCKDIAVKAEATKQVTLPSMLFAWQAESRGEEQECARTAPMELG